MRTVSRSHRHHGAAAQALVEFGLTAMVLLTLVVGIAQVGIILYANVTISSAARDGARVAASEPNTSTAFSAGSPASSSVQCNGSNSSYTAGGGADSNNPVCIAVDNSSGVLGSGTTDPNCPASAGSGCTIIAGYGWPQGCTWGTNCENPGDCPTKNSLGDTISPVPDGYIEITVQYRVPVIVPILSSLLSDPGTNYRTVTSIVTERVNPCTMTLGN